MYTMGLMAVDTGPFNKLSPSDQAAFRDVMESVYRRLDAQSAADDVAAQKAIQSAGIKLVEAGAADVRAWGEAVGRANQELGKQGVYSPALLETLQRHLNEYRQGVVGPGASGKTGP